MKDLFEMLWNMTAVELVGSLILGFIGYALVSLALGALIFWIALCAIDWWINSEQRSIDRKSKEDSRDRKRGKRDNIRPIR